MKNAPDVFVNSTSSVLVRQLQHSAVVTCVTFIGVLAAMVATFLLDRRYRKRSGNTSRYACDSCTDCHSNVQHKNFFSRQHERHSMPSKTSSSRLFEPKKEDDDPETIKDYFSREVAWEGSILPRRCSEHGLEIDGDSSTDYDSEGDHLLEALDGERSRASSFSI